MFNHARGLWGYTGTAVDGEPLTIQATGLGAASAAIITGELLDLGLQTFVRLGTARALAAADAPVAGEVVTVTGAVAADGPSQALGAVGTVLPDPLLTRTLARETGATSVVATADLLEPGPAEIAGWVGQDVALCDLQTAAVLQTASARGVAGGAVLVVTGPVGEPSPLDDDGLLAAVIIGAHAAAAAFGLPRRDAPPLPPPRDDEQVAA